MKLVFVHGWSVTNTNTYGELPEALVSSAPEDLQLDIHHIYLGRYISFHDEVVMEDIARAFNQARLDVVSDERFSCITHSTGGPVIRNWIDKYYGHDNLGELPLIHLIMLAPANHGSALAQLGKSRLSRIKVWVQGVELGQRILDWLELGSEEQWGLNIRWLSYQTPTNELFPFVITGQSIDKKFYDHLNAYTGESGSDGVIRVCAANMNYLYVSLQQNIQKVIRKRRPLTHRLEISDNASKTSPLAPLGVIPDASHSGDKQGIMKSVTEENASDKAVINTILNCLKVNNLEQYIAVNTQMEQLTRETQGGEDKFSMLVFYVHDDRGNDISDYDIFLLAGREYSPDKLPEGFFVDRQRNSVNISRVIYYINCIKMLKIKDKCFGIRVVARPQKGFSYYTAGEFRSEGIPLEKIFIPNQTSLIDIELKRHVDENVFRLDPAL